MKRALNSLSGRFLILTIIFVMLAEVFIFVPSIARFREDFLRARLDRAQIASLALLDDNMVDMDVEDELLANAEVFNVVLRRDEARRLVLSSEIPSAIVASFDLRDPPAWELIRDAMRRLFDPEPHVIRVIGDPSREAGLLIEITMDTAKLRSAMIDYGLNILFLSAFISVITALLLFLAVRRFLVRPIERVVQHMTAYANAPQDARLVIQPNAGLTELYQAEQALQSLQTQLTGALKQKDRLAQLGEAVAKISHDLRNILNTAQIFADRMEMSEDPGVKRAAPKLMNSLSRAVNLCESSLAFGKAEEAPPKLSRHPFAEIARDVLEGERLAVGDASITFTADIPEDMLVRCDNEQLHRVLSNLTRNARQAITSRGAEGTISISATETEAEWLIRVSDTGPGLPKRALDNIFTAFQGGTTKEGTGLGLVISAELVRGHGGTLELTRTDETGTEFLITLPKQAVDEPALTP